MIRENWAIFDLDNTIADINDRIKASTDEVTNKINYKLLHKNEFITKYDKPIKHTIDLINILSKFNVKILILTARADSTRSVTIDWLLENNVSYDSLILKEYKDTYVKSFVWKEKQTNMFIKKHKLYKKQFILSCDDYGKNQTMFNDINIPCLDPNLLFCHKLNTITHR